MKTYMTIEEVAHLLRVSVPTVRWLRQEGRFAPAIKIGRRLVWDEAEVLAWIENNRESSGRRGEHQRYTTTSGAARYRARGELAWSCGRTTCVSKKGRCGGLGAGSVSPSAKW